nr:VOC family protein [Candidatus Njordarchaeota archaeon]
MGNPIVHVEIPVTDLNKAKSFYSKLFQWKIGITPETDYALFDTGRPPNGGFSKLLKTGTNGFLLHILVDDIEKKLEEIEKAGGKTVTKKTEIPQFGWYATFKDIFGNILGLFTPKMKENTGTTNS